MRPALERTARASPAALATGLALLFSVALAGCGDGGLTGGDPDGGGADALGEADLAPPPDLLPPPDLAPPRSLATLRDRVFTTLLANGESPCARWNRLDRSARAVFLTITDRLYRSTTRDGLSMLDHCVKLYAVLGGGADGRNCGGLDNNRLFLGTDEYLHTALVLAESGAGQAITDGNGGYWVKSMDAAGPHTPFDRSAETQTGTKCILLFETPESVPPTGQVQFFKTGGGVAFTRGTASLPRDPYMLEFDHDFDCIHRSNPVCPGTDFEVRYTRHVGEYECGWVPVACRAAQMGCYPDAV